MVAGDFNCIDCMDRDKTGGRALAVFGVDSPVSEEVVAQLEAEPSILWVKPVEL